jgi:hypothetical protein
MSALGAIAVAKKKTPRPAEHDPGKWVKQPLAVQVRGRPEWKEWVRELASRQRLDVSDLVDQALAEVARRIGFREPPER